MFFLFSFPYPGSNSLWALCGDNCDTGFSLWSLQHRLRVGCGRWHPHGLPPSPAAHVVSDPQCGCWRLLNSHRGIRHHCLAVRDVCQEARLHSGGQPGAVRHWLLQHPAIVLPLLHHQCCADEDPRQGVNGVPDSVVWAGQCPRSAAGAAGYRTALLFPSKVSTHRYVN